MSEFKHPGLQAVYDYLLELHKQFAAQEIERDDLCDILDLFAGWCSPKYDLRKLDNVYMG